MARPKAPLLSREIIARAAIELVEEGHELQVVPLAERLGVSTSSLYHHVEGRVGIVHAIREVLGEEYSLTPVPSSSWEETVRKSTHTLWRLYGDHPKVMPLLLSVVITEPTTVDFYTLIIDALDEAGIPEDEQLSTVEMLDAFAFGVALDALSPDLIFEPSGEHERLNRLIRKHPSGRERNALLFERGLDVIVLGIRERARLAALGA
ncbi:TetR/AcrR family transcriptional regulator [Leucobacter denitrificans]|uniref:TetR/AcrR family transcriptional regulator n=1 Tax=Leucobacter denitrificans TaxID=683042 RepID=A0A7G9S242_9MICO|nr:TetR/AcrR family transcriptional regulator [Leucobacter denitrificans]QNN61917.1 TetR/AcrR family transcriptional regulator [Leucobacter denitrificans]